MNQTNVLVTLYNRIFYDLIFQRLWINFSPKKCLKWVQPFLEVMSMFFLLGGGIKPDHFNIVAQEV